MNLNIKNFIKYKKDGVIMLSNFFSNKEILALRKRINVYIKKNSSKLEDKEINLINNKINSVHIFRDIFFKKFSNQKKILDLGFFLLKSKPKIKHYEYFAKPKKVGIASPMHQDNFYWNLKDPNAFTIWIAIDSATKKNGSVEYLVGSHKKLYSHIESNVKGSSQKIKDLDKLKKRFKKKHFNLKPGDCLIHHSQIIHGSKKNMSGKSRRGFTIHVIPQKAQFDKINLQKYETSLKQQIKLRKKVS